MNQLEQQIDTIVRQVLARLSAGPSCGCGGAGSSGASSNVAETTCGCKSHAPVKEDCGCKQAAAGNHHDHAHESSDGGCKCADKAPNKVENKSVAAVSDTWNFAGRVLGNRELERMPHETKAIQLQRATVITPAVRDQLREKKIDLRLLNAVSTPIKTPSAKNPKHTTSANNVAKAAIPKPAPVTIVLGQAVENSATQAEATSLVQRLKQAGLTVQQVAQAGLESSLLELCDAVIRGGQRAILLTDQTWLAVALANRNNGVRAAWVRDRRESEQAQKHFGPNLLVVDPTAQTAFGLWNIVQSFALN